MNSSSEVRSRCAAVFSRVFQVDAATINEATSPESLFEWDSLGHVQLVIDLEKEFGVQIAPDEALELESFGRVVEIIRKKLS